MKLLGAALLATTILITQPLDASAEMLHSTDHQLGFNEPDSRSLRVPNGISGGTITSGNINRGIGVLPAEPRPTPTVTPRTSNVRATTPTVAPRPSTTPVTRTPTVRDTAATPRATRSTKPMYQGLHNAEILSEREQRREAYYQNALKRVSGSGNTSSDFKYTQRPTYQENPLNRFNRPNAGQIENVHKQMIQRDPGPRLKQPVQTAEPRPSSLPVEGFTPKQITPSVVARPLPAEVSLDDMKARHAREQTALYNQLDREDAHRGVGSDFKRELSEMRNRHKLEEANFRASGSSNQLVSSGVKKDLPVYEKIALPKKPKIGSISNGGNAGDYNNMGAVNISDQLNLQQRRTHNQILDSRNF